MMPRTLRHLHAGFRRCAAPALSCLLALACAPAQAPSDDRAAADAARSAAPDSSRAQTVEDPRIAAAFAAEGATGTMLIRRLSDEHEWVHNAVRADSAFLPASTFKIVNAAIALEIGTVTGTEEAFVWDGVEREFGGWNRDHTLRTGMAGSVVWLYQEIARRTGAARMGEWLRRLDYGNTDIGGGIDQFWLNGDLRTSAREQVDFLHRLLTAQTAFSPATVAAVSDMLANERGADFVLHAKTGWAFEDRLGWWVGWSVHDGDTYIFALNMAMPDSQNDPPRRIRIGRAALTAVGALP